MSHIITKTKCHIYCSLLFLGIKTKRRRLNGKTLNPFSNLQALKITPELKEEIIHLRKTLYWEFNILYFKEKLNEDHGIHLSYESIRKVLIQEGLHEPRQKKKIYRRRKRMPKAGMLVQMDSSQRQWIEGIPEKWWLIAIVDDADGFVYDEFHPTDIVWENMNVIKAYIKQKGLFMALYTEKSSHCRKTRHGGLHYQVEVEQKETQIERALGELGIKLINTNSLPAKGRIERRKYPIKKNVTFSCSNKV